MKQKETSNQFKPKQSPLAVVDAHRAATFSRLKLLPEQEPFHKILVLSFDICRPGAFSAVNIREKHSLRLGLNSFLGRLLLTTLRVGRMPGEFIAWCDRRLIIVIGNRAGNYLSSCSSGFL